MGGRKLQGKLYEMCVGGGGGGEGEPMKDWHPVEGKY